MANKAYQYGTSPRKLEPEYENKNKRNKSFNKNSKKKSKNKIKTSKKVYIKSKKNDNTKQNEKEKLKEARKNKILITINILAILVALFAIIWRNSLITQSFAQIQLLKSEISEIQKENDQLEISIQNNLNMNNIEQEAKEKLGMQKLTSKQTIYLNLPKKDYVEPSTEEVVFEEKQSVLNKIISFFENVF